METAEHQSQTLGHHAVIPPVSSETDHPHSSRYGDKRKLADEIDELRRRMTEEFLKEESFTSESVMEISRRLDRKINEYMRRNFVHR